MWLLALLAAAAVAALLSALSTGGSRLLGGASAALALGMGAALTGALPAVLSGGELRVEVPWAPSLNLWLALRLDGLSLLFALLVTGVGAAVFAYSGGYMAGRDRPGPFFAALWLFLGSMLGLVLADDLLLLCVCFELTGLASWVLIAWERHQQASRRAALQALLLTHAGGLCLLVAALWLERRAGTLRISTLTTGPLEPGPALDWIALLVLAACASKSALVPFQVWLPNAMRAPTPVSAYLHSAAMVKAGAFVLARLTPALREALPWTGALLMVGGATTVLGAGVAVRSTDLKRLLAGSTVLTLGLLALALGTGGERGAKAFVWFAAAHALYKAPLFMCAGALQHATGTRHTTELRGLARSLPLLALAAALAGAGMAGLPPTAGFQGKELTWEALLHPPGGAAPAKLLLATCGLVGGAALVVGTGRAALQPFLGRASHQLAEPVSRWLSLPTLALAALGPLLVWLPGWEGLLARAASAISGAPLTTLPSPWPHWGWPAALTAASLALGVAEYPVSARVRRSRAVEALDRVARARWDRLYERTLDLLEGAGEALERVFAWSTVRREVNTIALVLLVATGMFALADGALRLPSLGTLNPLDVCVALLVLLGALGAASLPGRYPPVVALGAVGYGLALLFLRAGAPDLAMAQVVVETMAAVAFAVVLVDLPRGEGGRGHAGAILLATGVAGLVLALGLSALARPFDTTIPRWYAEQALPAAHARNVVNAILVEFRALDTLGEVTTLLAAGAAALALARQPSHRAQPDSAQPGSAQPDAPGERGREAAA